MSDSAETMRINKFVTANGDGKIWSAGIDIKKDSEWHYNAIECHSSERELAIARRDAVFAALSASGTKSDGSRVRQTDTDRSHGESLQYGPDTTITTGTDASSIAAKVRDDGNVVNQVEASGRAPHVLLGPSDPILSQPDEREEIARILTAAKLLQQHAVGCATNHHGHDCELNGLPGWLADTKNNIDAAEDAIIAMQAERRGHDPLGDLVQRFADALLAKLRLAQANGRSGWDQDDWEEACRKGLMRHIEKGDPRDVAAYCAFMWHHGWSTTAPPLSAPVRRLKGGCDG